MSDEATPTSAVAATPAEVEATRSEAKEDVVMMEANGDAQEVATEDAPADSSNEVSKLIEEQTNSDKPATTQEGDAKKANRKTEDADPVAADSSENAVGTPASAAKAKGGKRKSSGVPEHKGKKLNKKASVPKMCHTDAKPGDYYYVRLKGFPLWPAIVCDESMLPENLIKTRPVTAARPDGTYREDYQDGAPKVKDRTFPVLYLHTNEFGWIPNCDLCDLDPEDVAANITSKTRKDLAAARLLAAEQHDLDFFKDILTTFMLAREAGTAAKKESHKVEKQEPKQTPAKKTKKSAAKAVEPDPDTEMADAIGDPESDGAHAATEPAKTNKRKAEDDTPQDSDSVKKPRRVIISNKKKATNGVSSPQAHKAATPKAATPKAKAKAAKPKKPKASPKAVETPEVVAPKEPELTAEEKRAKKEKEILFLRHKLQKGLLSRDQEPKETEMRCMSEFVAKLESYADLEVSMIRSTKINKVLKAILKLEYIPREEEYLFKERSQMLLDNWNKLLATDIPVAAPAVPAASAITNGNGEAQVEVEGAKGSSAEATNGTKGSSTEEMPTGEKLGTPEVVKDAPSEAEPVEEPKESVAATASVESTA